MASRQKDIKTFFKKLKKRYPDDPVVLSRDRKILEHLVFAIFLENVTFEQARVAFTEMQRYFIDWNEIRVSTASEIANVIGGIPNAVCIGERLRRLLQWVFDKTFKFDLEDMRIKGEEEVASFLETVPFSTRFMNDYVAFFGFDSGKFPLDEGSLRIFRLLGLVTVSNNQETAPCLATSFTSNELREFFFAVHELGAELMNEATRLEVLKFLKSYDPDVEKRSHVPLVESAFPTDPLEIARIYAKRERRPKSVASMMSDELIDDLDSDEMEEPEGLLDGSEGVESFSEFSDDMEKETSSISRGQRSGRESRRRNSSSEETTLSKDQTTFRRFTSETGSESAPLSKKSYGKKSASKRAMTSSTALTEGVDEVEKDVLKTLKTTQKEHEVSEGVSASSKSKSAKVAKKRVGSKSGDVVACSEAIGQDGNVEETKSKRTSSDGSNVVSEKRRKASGVVKKTAADVSEVSEYEERETKPGARLLGNLRTKVIKADSVDASGNVSKKSAKKEKSSLEFEKTSEVKSSKTKSKTSSGVKESSASVSKSECAEESKKVSVRRVAKGAAKETKDPKVTRDAKGQSGSRKGSKKSK